VDDQFIDARETIWDTLTRVNVRGILILHNFYDTEMPAMAWQEMYNSSPPDTRYNWRALPPDWFREWVKQGLLIKDEGYEVEKALGIVKWCDTDLYTLTEKGLEQYREQFSQGKRYL